VITLAGEVPVVAAREPFVATLEVSRKTRHQLLRLRECAGFDLEEEALRFRATKPARQASPVKDFDFTAAA
jgi:hypothetical protein